MINIPNVVYHRLRGDRVTGTDHQKQDSPEERIEPGLWISEVVKPVGFTLTLSLTHAHSHAHTDNTHTHTHTGMEIQMDTHTRRDEQF